MSALLLPTVIGDDPSLAFLGVPSDAAGAQRQTRRAEIKKRLTASEPGPTPAEQLLLATESALQTFPPTNGWEEWLVERIGMLQVTNPFSSSRIDETNPLSARGIDDEEAIEPAPPQLVTSRVDPGQAVYRQARLDLQKARKRERKTRRRQA